MTVVRWRLHDLSGVLADYTLHVNPDAMESPFREKVLTSSAVSIDGHARAFGRNPPHDWSFSGVLHAQAQYDALAQWVTQGGRSRLTDHLERTFVVRLKSFEPVRAGTKMHPWRHRYTCRVTTYGGPL